MKHTRRNILKMLGIAPFAPKLFDHQELLKEIKAEEAVKAYEPRTVGASAIYRPTVSGASG
jgi:hypothetical protein